MEMEDVVRAWSRDKYIVVERENTGVTNMYQVLLNGKVVLTINPKSYEEEKDLILSLNNEEDVPYIESLIENVSPIGHT